MSDDLVKRFSSYNIMMLGESGNEVPTPSGDWVKYKDYKAAADRIEELEVLLKAAIDDAKEAEAYAEQLENVLIRKKAKLSKSEALLAKALAELERLGFDFESIVGRQLKGQDDE